MSDWGVVRICKDHPYLNRITHDGLPIDRARTLAQDLSTHPGVDGKLCCTFHVVHTVPGFVIDGKPYPPTEK